MASFKSDNEKMKDFCILSKEKFLESYSYLSEQDYLDTVAELDEEWVDFGNKICHAFEADGDIYCNWYEVVNGQIQTDIVLEEYFIYIKGK